MNIALQKPLSTYATGRVVEVDLTKNLKGSSAIPVVPASAVPADTYVSPNGGQWRSCAEGRHVCGKNGYSLLSCLPNPLALLGA